MSPCWKFQSIVQNIKNHKTTVRSFTSLQMFHTHTHTHIPFTCSTFTQFFHMQLRQLLHTSLSHTQNTFTYNSLKQSILHRLLCLSCFPSFTSTPVCSYLKKLNCGVFRFFHLCSGYLIIWCDLFPNFTGQTGVWP